MVWQVDYAAEPQPAYTGHGSSEGFADHVEDLGVATIVAEESGSPEVIEESGDQIALPHGWYSNIDPATGARYYFNDNQYSTWDIAEVWGGCEHPEQQQEGEAVEMVPVEHELPSTTVTDPMGEMSISGEDPSSSQADSSMDIPEPTELGLGGEEPVELLGVADSSAPEVIGNSDVLVDDEATFSGMSLRVPDENVDRLSIEQDCGGLGMVSAKVY